VESDLRVQIRASPVIAAQTASPCKALFLLIDFPGAAAPSVNLSDHPSTDLDLDLDLDLNVDPDENRSLSAISPASFAVHCQKASQVIRY
jgi:hypothetical protein